MKNLKPYESKNDDISDWQCLIRGERKGLESIYRTYIDELFRFGCSLLNDPDAIRDFIQELFIDLWKYHANLKQTDDIRLYLFKSLSNRIYKSAKDEGRRKRIADEHRVFSEHTMESIESQLINLHREEVAQRKLIRAMHELPMRQKEVINSLFFEEFTYEQTSRLMNINLRSVYTLAWKAISSLRKSLG